MRIDQLDLTNDPVGAAAISWCLAHDFRLLHRDEVLVEEPSLVGILPKKESCLGWFLIGTPSAVKDAENDLPLFPGAPSQNSPGQIIEAGPDPVDMALRFAMDMTGFHDRDDLREDAWRPVHFLGDPFLAGNGHLCHACGGTGRGRSMIPMTDIFRRMTHLPSWCPSCDGWGRAPGPGQIPRRDEGQGPSSWRQARSYRQGLVRADTRASLAEHLLTGPERSYDW